MSFPPVKDNLSTAQFRQYVLSLLESIQSQGGGVLGSVSVLNFPATQAVSGTVGVSGNVEITNDVGNAIPVTDHKSGAAGGGYYTSSSGAVTGAWYAIQVLTAATFSAMSFSSNAYNPAITGVSIPIGTIIYGNFSGFTLSAGTVIAYNA
jgi:hypothetical protein